MCDRINQNIEDDTKNGTNRQHIMIFARFCFHRTLLGGKKGNEDKNQNCGHRGQSEYA